MTSTVLDASAVLAFLQGEDGADVVADALADGAVCGAANWSEVAQKVLASGRDWSLARGLLGSYGIGIEPVAVEDAEWAARRWRRGEGLSLADRLCLALGERLGAPVLTADRSWDQRGASSRSDSAPQSRGYLDASAAAAASCTREPAMMPSMP